MPVKTVKILKKVINMELFVELHGQKFYNIAILNDRSLREEAGKISPLKTDVGALIFFVFLAL
jgi:hypothetical protein